MAFQDAKILSARIRDLELRNGSLLEELEKWKLNFYDIDRGRTHDESAKRSAVKEKETAESEMKNLRNFVKMKEGELEEFMFKFKQLENKNKDNKNSEQKLMILSGEYEKLQRMYRDKSNEYEILKQNHYSLETSVHDFKLKEDRSQEKDNRLALLSTEINRLTNIIKSKNEEIENWRMNYSKLEYSTKEINVFENEIKRTRELLELRDKEVQEWKAKCIKYEGSINELKSSQFRFKENDDRLALYMSDIERLNHTIQAKNQEIERLEFLVNTKQGKDQEVWALMEMNENRLKEIEDLRMKCKRYEEISYDLRNKPQNSIEYENKLVMLSTELERVNYILRKKTEEIENMKSNYSRIDNGFEGNREWQTKMDVLSTEIQRLNSIIESQNREMHQSRYHLEENGYGSKNFEQNQLIASLTREIEDLRRRLYEKHGEIDNSQRSNLRYI